jgi:hypothetical protein
LVIFKKLPKVNNHPLGEKSQNLVTLPKRRTFVQPGHPALDSACLQITKCQMFAFVEGICHLGRSDVTNGTVPNPNAANVTVYGSNGKFYPGLPDEIFLY